MRAELCSTQWREEALTTWRASLATCGVVVKNRHCGRLDRRVECATHLERRGKTLEAILDAFNMLDLAVHAALHSPDDTLPSRARLDWARLAPILPLAVIFAQQGDYFLNLYMNTCSPTYGLDVADTSTFIISPDRKFRCSESVRVSSMQ